MTGIEEVVLFAILEEEGEALTGLTFTEEGAIGALDSQAQKLFKGPKGEKLIPMKDFRKDKAEGEVFDEEVHQLVKYMKGQGVKPYVPAVVHIGGRDRKRKAHEMAQAVRSLKRKSQADVLPILKPGQRHLAVRKRIKTKHQDLVVHRQENEELHAKWNPLHLPLTGLYVVGTRTILLLSLPTTLHLDLFGCK